MGLHEKSIPSLVWGAYWAGRNSNGLGMEGSRRLYVDCTLIVCWLYEEAELATCVTVWDLVVAYESPVETADNRPPS